MEKFLSKISSPLPPPKGEKLSPPLWGGFGRGGSVRRRLCLRRTIKEGSTFKIKNTGRTCIDTATEAVASAEQREN